MFGTLRPDCEPIKPIVKWAGGKRQLLNDLEEYFPKQFGTYYEPFLGGGAVYFRLASTRPPFRAVLSDINKELIKTYDIVEKKIDDLICELQNHKRNYEAEPEKYYYKIRDVDPSSDLEMAARLIFLNRTCFNGLYRVNSKGKFNVPIGRYENPTICDEEKLRAVHEALNSFEPKATILCGDFKEITKSAKSGDFVYFDPPYQPINQTSSFTSYTKDGFTFEDQKDLADLVADLHERGCHVLISNSDVPEITELYEPKKSFKIKKVAANRAINSKAKLRTGHTELIISNNVL